MKQLLIYFLLIAGLISCNSHTEEKEKPNTGKIEIKWADNLPGDFSFAQKWDYLEGIYKNESGQLSCDGFCPPETDAMKDEKGNIIKDSLKSFYKLVDTTHQFHSLESEAECYEWAGTNFATAQKINKDTILCSSLNNAATHSSLHLIITQKHCTPTIQLNSILSSTGNKTFICKGGQIEIDKKSMDRNILKAKFDFAFVNTQDSTKPMFWKGKIYTEIK